MKNKRRINWSFPKGRQFAKLGNPRRKFKAKGLPYGGVPEVKLRQGPRDGWSDARSKPWSEAAKGAAHDRTVTARGKRVKRRLRWAEDSAPLGGWRNLE